MSTTVTSTTTVKKPGLGGSAPPGPNGNGSRGNGWHPKKDRGSERRFPPETYRIAMWVALSAIVMVFAALGSVYIALSGGEGWQPVRMPQMFFVSTGIILVSSITIERARRSLKQQNTGKHARFMLLTLMLGSAFLGSQLLGWRQLVAQGVYLSPRPHSSFFYVFTGVHGVHVLGGLLGVGYLVIRSNRRWSAPEKKEAFTDVVSLYWHFMDGLWISLFLLLLLWR